jgi:hypothetical protein
MGTIIASLKTNSDSFEFIVSSDAVLSIVLSMRRPSMVEVIELMIDDMIDK